MTTATIELTAEQRLAADCAIKLVNNKGLLYRIGGYAGTGKTTVAKTIVEQIEGSGIHCAFTGKAALRLRQKGLPTAQTIHSAIYDFDPSSKKFHKKPEVDADYFLVDEGSMVSRILWDDMRSYELPIVVLGDPGQLQPVGDDPKLMHSPDIVMEHIHRQAEGSGIIQFATNIRHGTHRRQDYETEVSIIRDSEPSGEDLAWADIILCGFNRTRKTINTKIRRMHGYKGLLQPGETIIVLRNNKWAGVFNGQLLTIDEVIDQSVLLAKVKCHSEDEKFELSLFVPQFSSAAMADFDTVRGINCPRELLVLADYGYCITCHKSQGSEWDKVLVIDEQCPKLWSPQRWRYTAITRAAKELRYYSIK